MNSSYLFVLQTPKLCCKRSFFDERHKSKPKVSNLFLNVTEMLQKTKLNFLPYCKGDSVFSFSLSLQQWGRAVTFKQILDKAAPSWMLCISNTDIYTL